MKKRFIVLDELRGFFIMLMVLYHLFFDLVYIFRVNIPVYTDIIMPLQPIIPLGFAIIAGIGCYISNRNIRRGLLVFGCGVVVSLATILFMPSQLVVFGVLSMLGIGTILCGLLKKLFIRINPLVGAGVSALLFAALYYLIYEMPTPTFISSSTVYNSGALLVLGFPAPGFFSSDYFPIIPWVFAMFFGLFIGRLLLNSPPNFIYKSYIKPLEFIGRYSLVIYMLHQPIIYGVLYLIFI